MKAIYRGHLATITDCMGAPREPEEEDIDRLAAQYPSMADDRPWLARVWRMDGAVLDHELWVSFVDPELIVDPTDKQVEEVTR